MICYIKKILGIILTLLFSASFGYSLSGLDLLPYESKAVFGVKMNKNKLSQLKNNAKIQPQLTRLESYNINLENITIIYAGSLDENIEGNRPNIVIAAEGQFDQDKIYTAVLGKHDISKAEHLGLSYLRPPKITNYSIAILNNNFLVLAKEEHLKKVIELFKNKGNSVKKNQALLSHVNNVLNSNFAWGVFPFTSSYKQKLIGQDKKLQPLNTISYFSMQYIDGQNDSLVFSGICSNPKKMSDVQIALKSLLDQSFSLLFMVLKNNKAISEVANSAQYTTKGNTVTVTFTITPSQASELQNIVR